MKIAYIFLAIFAAVSAFDSKHQKVTLNAYQHRFPIPSVFQQQRTLGQQQTAYNQKTSINQQAVHGYQNTAHNAQNAGYNQQYSAYNPLNKQNIVYGSQKNQNVKYASKEFLAKQKFLFEIVYRVEDPLMFEEWIQLAQTATFNPSEYIQYDYYMQKFQQAYKAGALLPQGEFFGALVKTHNKQLIGLFNFFYFAKNFETFQNNVAWARVHVNEHMFIYALNLAVIHRQDLQGMILPSIYEIFPQYFFNSKFVYQAEKFDYDVWSKLVMYEKQYKDVLYAPYFTQQQQQQQFNQQQQQQQQVNQVNKNFYFYTKDFKTWQWWKLMGLGENWYSEDRFMLRDNIQQYNQDPKYVEAMQDVQMFWMPVDYTRDIDIFNQESVLSYFTEDLDWNAYWYYYNLDYAFFLDGKTFGLNKDRRGENYLYTVRQILARYYQERLSHGLGDIPQVSVNDEYEAGYDPQLIYHNGVGFSYRKNYYDIESYNNDGLLKKINNFFTRLDDVISTGYYKTQDGTFIDLRKPQAIEFIGNIMQGNVDVYDQYFFRQWNMFTHMYLADVEPQDTEVFPNIFVNYETMMRDPLFYSVYKRIADVYFQFQYYIKPYTQQELLFPGVTIKNVQVTDLVTYFDLVDFDVTNLLNDKMTFVDGQFVWDKTLLARQARLNHKPFALEFTIESDKPQPVVIRTFLGPKYDEFGRTISIMDNQQNFIELDQFIHTLTAGVNTVQRNSQDFYLTIDDRTTYTELYKQVMLALEDKQQFPMDISQPHCGFPDRLMLPRGWAKGMPMQLFVFVSPFTASYQPYSTYDTTYSCGIGSGVRYVDQKPFGYPFDRIVDELEFFVPNMYLKDVKIYHADVLRKYADQPYLQFGQFDYNYYNYNY
uniref:Uncharacterized protein n=1 Tax=Glossina morsitans morsitans TaxID=37546 RepID=A0A1B0GFD2_GLOMM